MKDFLAPTHPPKEKLDIYKRRIDHLIEIQRQITDESKVTLINDIVLYYDFCAEEIAKDKKLELEWNSYNNNEKLPRSFNFSNEEEVLKHHAQLCQFLGDFHKKKAQAIKKGMADKEEGTAKYIEQLDLAIEWYKADESVNLKMRKIIQLLQKEVNGYRPNKIDESSASETILNDSQVRSLARNDSLLEDSRKVINTPTAKRKAKDEAHKIEDNYIAQEEKLNEQKLAIYRDQIKTKNNQKNKLEDLNGYRQEYLKNAEHSQAKISNVIALCNNIIADIKSTTDKEIQPAIVDAVIANNISDISIGNEPEKILKFLITLLAELNTSQNEQRKEIGNNDSNSIKVFNGNIDLLSAEHVLQKISSIIAQNKSFIISLQNFLDIAVNLVSKCTEPKLVKLDKNDPDSKAQLLKDKTAEIACYNNILFHFNKCLTVINEKLEETKIEIYKQKNRAKLYMQSSSETKKDIYSQPVRNFAPTADSPRKEKTGHKKKSEKDVASNTSRINEALPNNLNVDDIKPEKQSITDTDELKKANQPQEETMQVNNTVGTTNYYVNDELGQIIVETQLTGQSINAEIKAVTTSSSQLLLDKASTLHLNEIFKDYNSLPSEKNTAGGNISIENNSNNKNDSTNTKNQTDENISAPEESESAQLNIPSTLNNPVPPLKNDLNGSSKNSNFLFPEKNSSNRGISTGDKNDRIIQTKKNTSQSKESKLFQLNTSPTSEDDKKDNVKVEQSVTVTNNSYGKENPILKLLHDNGDDLTANLSTETLVDALKVNDTFYNDPKEKLIERLLALEAAYKYLKANSEFEDKRPYSKPTPFKFFNSLRYNINLNDTQIQHIEILKAQAVNVAFELIKDYGLENGTIIDYAPLLIRANRTRYTLFTKEEGNLFLSEQTEAEERILNYVAPAA